MPYWDQLVGLLRDAMLAYAHMTSGNVGAGIVAVTGAARVLLLPLAVHLGVLAARHQAAVARLRPELDALRERWKDDPGALAHETRKVFAREGLSLFSAPLLLGGLAQWPVLLALFSAAQQVAARGGPFLWVRDVSRPDALVSVVVAALAGATILAGPQIAPEQRDMILAISVAVTLVTLSQMSAGVGLYWGASSAVGILQASLVARRRPS